MKAILISIQPKWCELIARGKKTVEVRKTKPKLETPFKVYIYCTKDEPLYRSGVKFCCNNGEFGNGKVIGEFVCNQIDTYDDDTIHAFSHEDYSKWNDFDLYNSCIHPEDFERYANDNWLYGWHISNLIIYDEPKRLSEFYTVDNESVKKCEYREQTYHSFTDTGYIKNGMYCRAKDDWCIKCKTKQLTRPPQSWCYVEEV